MTDDKEHGFVEGKWASEGLDHVRLKNIATLILLSEGFTLNEIREEVRVDQNPIDIVAEQDDGSLVMIECETRTSNPPPFARDVSYSSSLYKQGHQVLALTPDGLFELCDRREYAFVPCGTIQTSLQTGGEQRIGRWFENEYSTGEIPDVEDDWRWG